MNFILLLLLLLLPPLLLFRFTLHQIDLDCYRFFLSLSLSFFFSGQVIANFSAQLIQFFFFLSFFLSFSLLGSLAYPLRPTFPHSLSRESWGMSWARK